MTSLGHGPPWMLPPHLMHEMPCNSLHLKEKPPPWWDCILYLCSELLARSNLLTRIDWPLLVTKKKKKAPCLYCTTVQYTGGGGGRRATLTSSGPAKLVAVAEAVPVPVPVPVPDHRRSRESRPDGCLPWRTDPRTASPCVPAWWPAWCLAGRGPF